MNSTTTGHTNIAGIDVLRDAAVALAKAIQDTPEWREMTSARNGAENDEHLSGLMLRQNQLSRARQEAQAGGQAWPGQQMVEWITARDQILSNAAYQRFQSAGLAMVQLLQAVNQTLSKHLGVDFAATAAPRGGGCCG